MPCLIEDGTKLWLWKNGDHFLAYANEYPTCDGGDPMVLGEPFAWAIFRASSPPSTGPMELSSGSNTDPQPETASATSSAADLDAEIKHVLREGERYGAQLRRDTGHDTLLDRALYPAETPPSPPALVEYTDQSSREALIEQLNRSGIPEAVKRGKRDD